MRFAEAATAMLIQSDEWRMELRTAGQVVAEVPVEFVARSGGWVAQGVFGPFATAAEWDVAVLCSNGGVEEADHGQAVLPPGKVYRHSVVLGAD